jgi:hypothetical protein
VVVLNTRRVAVTAVLTVAAAAASAGCGRQASSADDQPLPAAQPVTSQTVPAEQPAEDGQTTRTQSTAQPEAESAADAPAQAAKPKRRSRAILSDADRASFTGLQARLGGRIGLAVSGLGQGQKVQRLGPLNSVIAWSTSKVPVAMAVYDGGLSDSQQANLHAAITASDNAAAERLWAALGSGQQAAGAADAQLQAAGDEQTQIQPNRLRAGFTPFGQTVWSLTDQARFTAGMACVPAGAQVLGLMNQTVASQRWGLGAAGVPAQLKGGWGPGSQPGVAGGYLDRQMGVLTIHGKPLAVTVASLPADGSHGSGTAALTAIARWVVAHANVRRLPARPHCD